MIAIDLHVHTQRYSPCAELLNPLELAEGMHRAGIQGLVITEHDVLWARDELEELNRRVSPGRVYRGVEVSTQAGHVVVIGIERSDSIRAGMTVAELADIVTEERAVAIWAHPPDDAIRGPLTGKAQELTALLHAVEVLSTVTTGEKSIAVRAFAKQHGLAAVAGSDAHCIEQIGTVCTLFRSLPGDEKALAHLIRGGEGLAIRTEASRSGRMRHVA